MNSFSAFWRNFWIGTLVSITLAGILIFLDTQNLLSLEFQFIGAKAIIGAQGPDPRLSAIGFAFPPFLIYLTMLVSSPISTQILLGTGLVVFMIWLVSQLRCQWWWRAVILTLLLVNPAFLIMLLTSPTWTAISLFMGLSILLYWHLINPRDQKYPLSVNLVLLGLTLAPLVLLRYELWFLLPVFMVLSWFCIQTSHIQLKFTMVLVTGFMSMVSIAGFLYVNWLISSDPFYFYYVSGNGLRWPSTESFLVSASGFQALWSSLAWLGTTLPVYYVLGVFVFHQIKNFLVARILLMTLPILILIFLFWQNNFLPQAAIFGAFSILIPVTLLQFPQIKSNSLGLIVMSLLLGFIIAGHLLNHDRFTPEESLVWRQITGQSFPKIGTVFRWRQRQLDQQEISHVLFQKLRPGQKVLLDDAVNFNFIYLLQSSDIFILPHQYEFSVALSQPEEAVDYILVRKELGTQPMPDKVLNSNSIPEAFPNANMSNRHRNQSVLNQQLNDSSLFNGFEVIVNNTFYQLFQRL
jgi:hypothetical protein